MKAIIHAVLSMFFLCIIVFGSRIAEAKDGSQEVLKNLDDFQKSLSNWMQGFDKLGSQFDTLQKNVNESLLPLKDAVTEIKGMQGTLNLMVPRLTAIEQSTNVAQVSAMLVSFNETLAVIKKLVSDITKRVEDQEVKTAVLEKRYQEAQRPLEPIKKAIEDMSKLLRERLSEQEKRIAEAEESIKTRVQSFEEQLKPVGKLQEQVEKLEKARTVVAGTVTPEAMAAGTETGKVAEGAEITEAVKKEEHVSTPEEEGYKNIGDNFYIRNVDILPFGSSSQIKGEIKNLSDNDRSIAVFTINVYNSAEALLFKQDFSIKTFKKGEIRTFNEIISGYTPLDIARYEIIAKRSY